MDDLSDADREVADLKVWATLVVEVTGVGGIFRVLFGCVIIIWTPTLAIHLTLALFLL